MIHLEICTPYPSKPVSHPLSQAGGLLDARFRLFHQMAASIPTTINDLPDEFNKRNRFRGLSISQRPLQSPPDLAEVLINHRAMALPHFRHHSHEGRVSELDIETRIMGHRRKIRLHHGAPPRSCLSSEKDPSPRRCRNLERQIVYVHRRRGRSSHRGCP